MNLCRTSLTFTCFLFELCTYCFVLCSHSEPSDLTSNLKPANKEQSTKYKAHWIRRLLPPLPDMRRTPRSFSFLQLRAPTPRPWCRSEARSECPHRGGSRQ